MANLKVLNKIILTKIEGVFYKEIGLNEKYGEGGGLNNHFFL